MIKNINLNGINYRYSEHVRDFFRDNPIHQENMFITMDIMNDCVDTAYSLLKDTYPKLFKPDLLFSDSNEVNAFALGDGRILITDGLISHAARLIEQRYTPDVLSRYQICQDYSHKEVLSHLRVYLWRFVILHELYHIWDGHAKWKQRYKFDIAGKLTAIPLQTLDARESSISFESEMVNISIGELGKYLETYQRNITQQALEFDADSSAVCMMVNLLMRDAKARQVADLKKYVRYHIGLIMGALATAFCLFDGNAGAKFESLQYLDSQTHPIPAIRMVYAEEIADGALSWYFKNFLERMDIESEWLSFVVDAEPDHNGVIDIGQVFYFPAYTEKAQRHICKIKRRLTDMHDTLSTFVLGNLAEKLADEDISFLPISVWFTEDGRSLRGWKNPTGS